jgi:hypothetical protein
MPITVSLPSRNVELEFPDSMTEQEIQQAIDKEYPRSGQDVAFEVDQATQQSVEGGNLVNPFDQMSNDDYIMFRNHLAQKKSSFGDALGIAVDTVKNITDEIGTGIGATAYNVAQGNVGQAYESAKQGLVAGTVGLVDIADKILNPVQEIPNKEEFLKQTKDQPTETIADESSPFGRKQIPNTEQDYVALVEQQKARDRDATNRLFAIEASLRGAPIEEVSRAFQYVDPGLLTGGASALIRGGAKTLFKAGAKTAAQAGAQTGIQTAGRVAASTAPGPIKQAALTAVETGAGAAQLAGSLPGRAIQLTGDVMENLLPGTGAPVKAVGIAGGLMSDLGVSAAGLAATEKAAEVVKGVARAAKGEASRVGPLEQVAMNPSVSPTARKLAAGLAQVQPIFGTAGRIAGQALKEAGVGAAVGAGLGYLAERNLEGAAAAAGAGTVFGGATGVFRGTFRAGREALGYSTERTARQATGDINSFIAERPEMEQAAWAQTMNRLAQNIGPEKAAAQADALRIAEANGSKVRLATPDETKQWQNPGWLNIDGNGQEIVLNPQQILGDTAAHETAHVLFASTLNRAFRPEIETAIFGTVDPVNGEIIRPGLFSDPDLAKVADQIADSYGNNTTASNEFRGYANRLRNTTDAAALSEARTRIADELTATYTGKLFGRLRAGRFNPDRLPLVYRRVLNGIEDSIVDKLRTTLFEQGMDLGFNAARGAFTDAKGRLVRIPELDAIIKKAMQPSRKTAAQAKVKGKPDLIPTNPVDRAIWARSYGGARGILNDDLTPKSVAQMEQEKVARWQDMTSRLSALPESERTGIQFSRDAKGNTVMTAKGQLSDAAINQILSSKAFDQSSVAVLREVLTSLQNFEKATFDTRYYGVYDRGRGGSKMVAGVKSASQNEILPYSVEANSQQGVIIRAVDMTAVRDRLMTALKKPQFKDLYSNGGEAMKDFRAYLTNLTNINAVPSDIMFGGGPKGAQKRNLFYDALGFRLRNNETLLNAPADVISKSQNTIKSYRVERFAKLVDSGERLAFEEATTFERAMKNFQPSAFVREALPNGETLTNPDGYRILKKTGGKLFRVYDDNGALLGTSSSEDAAMKKAQSDYAKKVAKEEPAIKRFQFAGESAQMPQFMRDSLETAKSMAAAGKSSAEIRAITGWFPGKYDDKMRWEVPDNQASWNRNLDWITDGQSSKGDSFYGAFSNLRGYDFTVESLPLKNFLDHPDLYSAYPEAKEIQVRALNIKPAKASWGPAGIVIDNDAKPREALSSLLHEVQHWIQDKEGFAKGGSLEMAQQLIDIGKQAVEERSWRSEIKRSGSENAAIKEYKETGLEDLIPKKRPLANKTDSEIASLAKLTDEKVSRNPIEAYRKFAGEIESRDIQARQNFTPEQRKAIEPYSSENIAKEEAIVLKEESPAIKRFQPVSPEQDAAFLRAAQAGDTATTQKMVDEAAKKAGYNSPKLFHGTGAEFTIFDKKRGGSSTEAQSAKIAFFFTDDEATAKAYSIYAAEEGPVKAALKKAELAEKREDWNAYDAAIQEAESLENYEATLKRRESAKVVSTYLRGDFLEFDAKGQTPQELSDGDIDKGITNQLRKAQRAGKAGVLFKNLDDAVNLSNRPSNHYAVFDPNQIKSADPITYDDSGNIIPLSQRFNVASPDIRFQPDSASPSILNGSNGTRIIKSSSGKFRVYSATGALLGIRDTEEAAKKLATK